MKRISILGSTGSIGRQCLSVVDSLPGRFEVIALAAGSNVALIAEQISRHHPKVVAVGTEANARELCAIVQHQRGSEPIEILFGAEGIVRVATDPDVRDSVVSAAVGVVGLRATYIELSRAARISLLRIRKSWSPPGTWSWRPSRVTALIFSPWTASITPSISASARARITGRFGVSSLPRPEDRFARNSGFPALADVTPEQALAHPNWKNGTANYDRLGHAHEQGL